MSIFVCSGAQLVRLEHGSGAWRAESVLERPGIQCVAAHGERVLVGTRGHGVFSSENGGAGWAQLELPEPNVFAVAISAADGAAYAGTEPSRLFVARDGTSWEELQALQRIPSRQSWSFPPRPWTHHVRWIAPDPHRAERLLVGIELGGLMYSADGGETFSDHRAGAKRDVHCLAWHPVAEGRAYQAAGDGAAWSRDGGLTWEAADSGRDLGYCWALAVDPSDPECWYVSAASGPGAAHGGAGARGRLYRWNRSWHELATPPASMPYALLAAEGELLVGMADGRLMSSGDRGETWREPDVELSSVTAMAAAERAPLP